MKKNKFISFILFCVLTCGMLACSDDNPVSPNPDPEPEPEPKPTPSVTYQDGYNYDVEVIDADKPVTITFKAPSGTALYGSTGDMYLYSGIGAGWEGAPSNWTDNNSKYKMTAVAGKSNTWSITITPSIRSFYGISDNTSIQLLNLIVRNADGTKQTGDYATLVQDSKHDFKLGEVEKQGAPVSAPGIYVNSPSSVTLALYDKDKGDGHKEYAFVTGSFNNWQLDSQYKMKYDETSHCWWITLNNLSASNIQFQYFVYSAEDGGTFLCDPYSEQVLEKNVDSNFPQKASGQYVTVVNTTPETYVWSIPDFTIKHPEKMVIYEMLLRDFTSSHNIAGAKEKLSYLKAMGVNAIELMPVQEFSGGTSWGYDTSFYFALDGTYGTPKEYKEFIDMCHQAGIAVIFDVVYNHTNNNNPFAKMYWDFYNNRPSSKNPWLNAMTPHKKYVFSPDDFDHSSELTQTFVKRNLKYLLDTYNIDGFRFDFTKGFTQKNTTGDNDLSAYDADRVSVLKEYYDAVKAAKDDAIVIMEHFCDAEERELSALGVRFWRNINNSYMQSAMGYIENSDFSWLYDTTSPEQFVGFMESHDEERAGYKQSQWGKGTLKTNLEDRMKQLEANSAFFFTVPGPKMIWQFGELGYDFSINSNEAGTAEGEEYRTDRKPIRWDYYENKYRKGLYDVYSKLIDLRNKHRELFDANTDFRWKVSTFYWDNGRFIESSSTTKKMIVVGNFTSENKEYEVSFPVNGIWYNYLNGETLEVSSNKQVIAVPAHTAFVFTTFKE